MAEWKHAFDARDDLQQYTDNAIGRFDAKWVGPRQLTVLSKKQA